MANEIVTVLAETDLRNGHQGLMQLAQKNRINVLNLEAGSFVLFLNRKQTAFKLYAANNTIVHYKHPRGRVNLGAIEYFPRIFNAGKFSYDKALAKLLDKKLKQ
jgi:hypothetical protein